MVMDPAGTAIVATDPAVMGKNFKFREYFRTAMEGRPFMTGIIVGSVAGAAGVFYSRPVFDANGKVIGAVVMRIKADPIGRMLANTKVGNDRLPFLVDEDGVIVWHPDERMMFKSLTPLSKDVLDEIVADQRFRRKTIETIDQPWLAKAMVGAKQPGNVTYYSNVNHRDEIAGYAPVPGHNWTVGVSEVARLLRSPARPPVPEHPGERGPRRARCSCCSRWCSRAASCARSSSSRPPPTRSRRATTTRPTSRCAPTTRSASSRAPST
jgi:C4-dicarboxylate-specific signal transduction histidine kinase